MTAPLRLMIVAGESSADLLAAGLVKELRRLTPRPLELAGIGGPALAAEGLSSLFPMADLAVMGLVEILPRLALLRRRLAEAEALARRFRPELLLTVDGPGFNLRLLRRLRDLPMARVHYVAPQAWAWRPGRAAELAHLVDRLLLILPFEQPFFDRYGVASTHVGHPAVEWAAGDPPGRDAARTALGIPGGGPLLCLLPGSRQSEITRHLPLMRKVMERLGAERADLRAVLPAVPHLAETIRQHLAGWRSPPLLVEGRARRLAFHASDLALTASGTVTLELALARRPMVVMHRLHPLTGLIARRLIRVPHVALPNLILGRGAVPELLQGAARPDAIAAALLELLRDPERQQADLDQVAARLRAGDTPPSRIAAAAALEVLAGRRR